MTQPGYNLELAIRQDANHHAVAGLSPAAQYSVDSGKHCAYNQTRQRFLSTDVDAADFSIASLDARLPTLARNSGADMWLVPFRGISPTSVRVPVDLVYLDRHCTVIDTVESFPISRVSASSPLAESVLVLPADTIRSTETQPGDQLVLCSPDEMKQRLQRLANSSVDAKPEQTAAPVTDGPVRSGAGRLLRWEDRSGLKNPAEKVPALDRTHEELPNGSASLFPESQETGAAEPALKRINPAKSWLQRLLSPDPPQRRRAPRESLPGLAAYFFTGGAPVAHDVRDISLTGVYVFTKERWYLGTGVRMTLTDRLEPTVERSVTLNMTVVRWGNDGVGLMFVLQKGKDRRRRQADGMADGVDKMQIDKFLQRLRSARDSMFSPGI